MAHYRITDWENAYANGVNIPRGERWPDAWVEPAHQFREMLGAEKRAQLDIPYGEKPRNRFDLFLPEGAPKGLVVFVHGGYWVRFDKSFWSHLAAGPLAHGHAVAMPSYTLCPDISISGIVKEIGAAIQTASGMVEDGPLRLVGHSAGGHLAARQVCTDSPLDDRTRARIVHTMAISGVHDLRPLLRLQINESLKLDLAQAHAESPALLEPLEKTRLTCWVGATERTEFVRQNALLANVWTGLGAQTLTIAEPDRHHFDVIDGLIDPAHALTRTLMAE